ncbi:UPF0056 membrane protein YhcE [Buchnera aphidicola (Cinara pseudotaxifoliae)]|uniref:UPF0056 membrane protein n=1 Tax=Buchnera aphidicola (Cinara pseudotaxifoliae) TaxID=655384 RepID=A0A451DGW6_9GAMM|nr:MarC family protein [Buchnera aphidicola]VFP85864.1 UPF0056 membrane protein YhcE [Buchnera aphidicola (Cinara pseudotaxifoliae)]
MNFLSANMYLYLNFFVTLFILITPINIILMFLSSFYLKNTEQTNQVNILMHLSLSIILCITLFLGSIALNFFNTPLAFVSITEGIMMLFTAWAFLKITISNFFSKHSKHNNFMDTNMQSPYLALITPFLLGIGSIKMVIAWSIHNNSIYNLLGGATVIILFSIICCCICKISLYFSKFINYSIILTMIRIFGFLLLTVSIKSIIYGIHNIFCTPAV